MNRQAFEPGKLVVELWSRLRIAVGEIDATDENAGNRGFDVAGVRVVAVTWQLHAGHDGFGAAREDSHTVPGLLTPPNRLISGVADGFGLEFAVGAFQLLQANDIRRGAVQPLQEVGQPAIDVVDVEGGDFHRVCDWFRGCGCLLGRSNAA